MASNINPYNIDGTFPIANQDNPSQGFRDNFTNIKNNFVFAQNELDDLQSKVLLTGALNGQTLTNDMAGTQIRRPQLASWTQSAVDLGAIAGASVLDFSLANFQKLTSAGSISLSFVNWPASVGAGAVGYGVMRVWLIITDIAHTLTTPTSVSIGITDLAGSMPNGDGTYTITFDAPGNYIFDFSSINSGANYQIFDLSRNRSTFRDPDLYFNAEVNSTFLIGYGAAALPVALELEQGADKVSVQGSYNSVSAGTNYTGNIAFTQGDNGPSAGYSVSGLRGNLAIGEVNSIQNNDFVGYFNALTFTGDGAGGVAPNTVASIGFYARGTDPANGLGGNITLWTTPDGTGSTPFVAQKQAIGIENDQSVTFYGNVTIVGSLTGGNIAADSGPAFIANVSTGQGIPTSPSTISQLSLIYDNVSTNDGSGYNSSTGVFTAPKSGFYQVSASISVTPSNWSLVSTYDSAGVIGIYKNSNPIASGPYIDMRGVVLSGGTVLGVTTSSSVSTGVYLNTGDTLNCALAYLTTAPNNFWNTSTNLVEGSFTACWLQS